jgi:hypothetical protein
MLRPFGAAAKVKSWQGNNGWHHRHQQFLRHKRKSSRSRDAICIRVIFTNYEKVPLAHDPEKHALGLDPGVASGFRTKIMRL